MLNSLDETSLYVIVFGPGFGESIVLRIPPDDWIVVDGCRADERSPAAELLGRHDAKWSCIVLTHKHEDHTIGLDDVLQRDGAGPIGCVAPLIDDPANWRDSNDGERYLRKGTTEHVLATIDDQWKQEPASCWEMQKGTTKQIGAALLTALWPDAASVEHYKKIDTNALSSSVLVQWEGARILLGADLPSEQWSQIGNEFGDLGNHCCFKVSHHASISSVSEVYGANQAGISRFWIATPWRLAGGKLPRFEDNQGVHRLLQYEAGLHLTSLPNDCAVEGMIPYRATRPELASGSRPQPVIREVAPGFRLRRRRELAESDFSCFVAVPISSSGVIGAPLYGDGSVVVS